MGNPILNQPPVPPPSDVPIVNTPDMAQLAQLTAAGHGVSVNAFDVTDESAVNSGMAEIERTHGAVDILVNNAAVNNRKPFDEYTLAEWRGWTPFAIAGLLLTLVKPSISAPFFALVLVRPRGLRT